MSMPFISIGISSYNYSQYLVRAFEAIKKQSFTDFEIIYVDDCSTDNSVEIINGFITDNPQMKIRLIKNEMNMGLIYSKNLLLKESRGKYVMLCDSDDWMLENCLQVLSDLAIKTNADRIIPQIKDIDENGKVIQIQDFSKNQSKWLWNMHHGVLYKKSVIDANKLHILAYPDDIYFTTEFNKFSSNTIFVPKPLYVWYVNKNSAGRAKLFENKRDAMIDTYSNLFKYLKNQIEYLKKLDSSDLVFEGKTKDANISEVEFLILKAYYLSILGELRKYPLLLGLKGYDVLRKELLDIYPDYRHNIFLKHSSISPMRSYATKIVRLCYLLEKFKIFKISFIIYRFLSTFIFFDQ